MYNKKINIYVFISSLARNLLEIFISLILFCFGKDVKIMIFIIINMFFDFNEKEKISKK